MREGRRGWAGSVFLLWAMAMAGLMKGGGRYDELQSDSLYLDYVMLCVLIDCVWPDADSIYVISMSWRSAWHTQTLR